jgi:hypothetical protein
MIRNHQLELQTPLDSIVISDFIKQVHIPVDKPMLFIVDDPTRPPNIIGQLLMDYAIDMLSGESVEVLVASGMHRQPTMREITDHIGINVIRNCRVHRHNPTVELGWYVQNIFPNYYVVTVGTVMPHTFMGLSGSGKILSPGLEDEINVRAYHESGREYASWLNRQQFTIPDYTIQVVINKFGQPCLLWGREKGTWDDRQFTSFREQALLAYTYDLPKPGNAAVLAPWYKNSDLLQCLNAVTVCQHKPVVVDGGMLAIDCRSAGDGIGVHYLFQPFNGKKVVKYDEVWDIFKKVDLSFIVSDMPKCAVQDLFEKPVSVYDNLDQFEFDVERKFGVGCPIDVYQGADIMIGV